MYIPKHFQMPESGHVEFIRQFPLATMVIATDKPMLAQCPLIYNFAEQQLLGHFAANNPIIECMHSGQPVTVLFSGNQGYVSANWYAEAEQAANREVPTWNYSSLEICGTVTMVDTQQTRSILQQQTRVFESRVNENWRLDKLSEEQISAMLGAIRGFVIKIETAEGKHKLSQNKSPLIRERLVQRMQLQSNHEYGLLINAMQNGNNT